MSLLIRQSNDLKGQLQQYVMPAPTIPLTDFLRRVHGERRVHWQSGRDSVAFAGYGAVLDVVAEGQQRFQIIRQILKHLFQSADIIGETPTLFPTLFGGFAFRDDFTPHIVWQGMYAAHFVLPKVMYLQTESQSYFVLNHYQLDGQSIDLAAEAEQIFDNLFWNDDADLWNPEWEEASTVEYPMSSDDWGQMIRHATTKIQQGDLDKVVLSRMCQIRFNQPVNVVRALDYVAMAYPECHRFLFETQSHQSFYGATPETLVRVNRGKIQIDSLAGTVKRGETDEQDTVFGNQLMADMKERHEHDFVVQGIRESLANFADDIHADPMPSLLKLNNVQHLHTPITAQARPDVDVLTLVEQLHPTPALGGKPKAIANELIEVLEPMTRGWYAAPIGWLDANLDGHFGVAIRSAISRDGTVWCYAGAGIVAESEPEREWRETDLKFRPMLNAIGIDYARSRP